jgi:glycosyltransferase involved in cell wall biosynthesis
MTVPRQARRKSCGTQPPLVVHLATVDVSLGYLLLPQLLRLKKAGYNVAAACSPGPGVETATKVGIPYFPVRMDRSLLSVRHFSTLWRLVRLLRRERVCLLHVHPPVAATLGRVAAWLARTPLVFYTAHGFYFHDDTPARYRVPLVALERLLGKVTDHLFTQSAEDYETAVSAGISSRDAASYLGNGVDVEAFAAAAARRETVRQELGLGDETVVAFTGRFVREKGVAELLGAFGRARQGRSNLTLLIIGGSLPSDRDPAEVTFAALVQRLRLSETIISTGLTDRVADYLSAADIFVLPSYREGMPRSIIEAMAAGKPVVATDIRGCREEVVEGETGFLVPARDTDRLAQAIGRLVDDPALRRRMGAAGQARARDLFDERLVFDRLLAVYEQYLPLAPAAGVGGD